MKKKGQNFTNAVAQSLQLTPKLSYEEKRKTSSEKLKNSHEKTKMTQKEGDIDLQYFLASGKSFNQHDRDRFAAGFLSYEDCEDVVKMRVLKEKEKKVKPKLHHGPFHSYEIDHDQLKNALSKFPQSRPINWTRLAKKINLSIRGKTPANAGQVLKQYATSNKIITIPGKDYLRRIRRHKKKINYKISIPTQRSAKIFKSIVKQNIQSKKFDKGEEIAPKPYKTNFINNDGELEEKITQIHGRKISLTKIISRETARLQKAGVVRDTNFHEMSMESLNDFCNRIHESSSHITASKDPRERLQKLQKTWKLKMWHDHSDILNHSYVSFMTCFLYDPINFLTDQEFREQHPEKNPVNVQSIVERPQLYIFGISGNFFMLSV